MKFLHLFTPSLYIVLNAHSASAAYLQGKACDYLDDQCGRDKYCQAATGQCLLKSASIPGTCEVPPQTCNLDYNPVCGCDNYTYDNECLAHTAGVSVANTGECSSNNRDVSCTVGDNTCKGNEYCKGVEGACGGDGRCTPMPTACTMDYTPVCGCDNWTYGNSCEAESVGENIFAQGECATEGCIPDERPRPVREGYRIRFNLEARHAICVDQNSKPFEYGQFQGIVDSNECSEYCVNEVTEELAIALLGFDYDCANLNCNCLYTDKTLNGSNVGQFDWYDNNSLEGIGPISGTAPKDHYYCFKRVGSEEDENEDQASASVSISRV